MADYGLLAGFKGIGGAQKEAEARALQQRLVEAQLQKAMQPEALPANIREYGLFQQMSPEQQSAYTDFIRTKTPSFGGSYAPASTIGQPKPIPQPASIPSGGFVPPEAATNVENNQPTVVTKPVGNGLSIPIINDKIDANESLDLSGINAGAKTNPPKPDYFVNDRGEYDSRGAPTGMIWANVNGQRTAVPVPGSEKNRKPLPASVVKLVTEEKEGVGLANSIKSDLAVIQKQLEGGQLDLGFFTNRYNAARNNLGKSTEESRNYDTFQKTLTRMVNDSLRLNKGVQTEGDAQRAVNEITSTNDPILVKERIGELMRINERAAALKQMNIDSIYANYGMESPNMEGYKLGAAVGDIPPDGQPKGMKSNPAPEGTVIRNGNQTLKKVGGKWQVQK